MKPRAAGRYRPSECELDRVLAANLLQASDYAEKSKEEGLLVLEIFDEMRVRRNAIVHGTPVYGEHGMLVGRLARFSARKAKVVVTVSRWM